MTKRLKGTSEVMSNRLSFVLMIQVRKDDWAVALAKDPGMATRHRVVSGGLRPGVISNYNFQAEMDKHCQNCIWIEVKGARMLHHNIDLPDGLLRYARWFSVTKKLESCTQAETGHYERLRGDYPTAVAFVEMVKGFKDGGLVTFFGSCDYNVLEFLRSFRTSIVDHYFHRSTKVQASKSSRYYLTGALPDDLRRTSREFFVAGTVGMYP